MIQGDGIGKEVIPASISCIEAVLPGKIDFIDHDVSSDRYLKTGQVLEDDEIEAFRRSDSILFGAIGDPRVKPGIMERGVLLRIRKELNLFLNLRPSRSLPFSGRDFNLSIARENTEEFYMGFGGKLGSEKASFSYESDAWSGEIDLNGKADDDLYFNIGVMSRRNTERFFRSVVSIAKSGNHRNVTVVDKANAVPGLYEVWREEAENVISAEGLGVEFMYGDAVAYDMVRDPSRFGLIAAPNLYGDILSDLSSGLMGGLGFTPSGNYGSGKAAFFEPVHGSAPDIAGRGMANPIGAILSGSMMLSHMGYTKEAGTIESAVKSVLESGVKTFDIGGSMGTKEVAGAVIRSISELQ